MNQCVSSTLFGDFPKSLILDAIDLYSYVKIYSRHYLATAIRWVIVFICKLHLCASAIFSGGPSIIYARSSDDLQLDLTCLVTYFFRTTTNPTCVKLQRFLWQFWRAPILVVDIIYTTPATPFLSKMRLNLAEEREEFSRTDLIYGEISLTGANDVQYSTKNILSLD